MSLRGVFASHLRYNQAPAVRNLVKQQSSSPRRSLLDKKQTLGIIPTAWFWTHENQKPIAWFLFPLSALLALIGFFITKALGGSTLMLLALTYIPPFLLLGLVERLLRRRVLARRDEVRRELLTGDERLRALPPEDDNP